MAEVTREFLEQRKADYQRAIVEFTGAVAAIEQIIKDLYPADGLPVEDLRAALGAQSVEVVEHDN